jgi:hypothetical protein
MRLRVAEIDDHPVTHILGNKTGETADRLVDDAMIGADRLLQVFRIGGGAQCR